MYDKESYKTGLRKGQFLASNAQTEELIHALNQLTAEVNKANAIREQARETRRQPVLQQVIRDLQDAIGDRSTGILTSSNLRKMVKLDRYSTTPVVRNLVSRDYDD